MPMYEAINVFKRGGERVQRGQIVELDKADGDALTKRDLVRPVRQTKKPAVERATKPENTEKRG